MRPGARGILPLIAAGVAGLVAAVAVATADSPQTVTLGSTSTPAATNTNLPPCSIGCTYVPFTSLAAPEMKVPFDGTVTSFSVNSGSSGNVVELRVLRPGSGGSFTAVATGPAETLQLGTTTFSVSVPVHNGDVLGLDDTSNALVFDNPGGTWITGYYQPPLADKSAGVPASYSGYRLLMSATVQASPSTTTTTTTTTTSTSTPTSVPPQISNASQSNRVWREGHSLATFSRKHKAKVGTTFSFSLNEPAQVSLAFTRHLGGRKVNGRCVAPTKRNRSKPGCSRSVPAHALRFSGHAGVNRVRFQGLISRTQTLPLGSYTVAITATNSAGQRSNQPTLSFKVVG